MSTQSNFTQPKSENFPELGGVQGLHPSPAHFAVTQDPDDRNLYQVQQFQSISRLATVNPGDSLVVISICSLVVLIQAAVECGGSYSDSCSDVYGYTVSVGAISWVVSLICRAWCWCGPSTFAKFSPIVAIFFLVWWGLGTAVSTFKEPFSKSGNGYFAAWGAFITSFIMAGAVSERLRTFLGSTLTKVVAGSIEAKLSMGIGASSVVLLAAVAVEATDYDKPTGQELWGVICGFASGIFVLIHTILRIPCERITLPPTVFGIILSVWWLSGVVVLTFDGPFKYSSNGYFATWLAFIFSIWLSLEGLDGYGGMGFAHRKRSIPAPGREQNQPI